jgi:hypothetical protein
MGLGPGGLVAGLVAPHLVTMAVCVLSAAVIAVGLSSHFPIGLARQLDPDVGIRVDGPVLAIGLFVTALVVVLASTAVATIAVRRTTRPIRRRRGQLVGVATRAGASVPAAVGASLALEAPPRRIGGTSRPALIAAIVGILGVVGAATLVGGINDALHQPARVGRVWDLEASPADSGLDQDGAFKVVAANPDIVAVGAAQRVATLVDGKDVPMYSVASLKGSVQFVTLHGRAPNGNDEIALGPRTASLVHAGVGDTVTAGPSARPMKVVGITLLAQTPHSSFDEGALVPPDALAGLVGGEISPDGTALLLRLRHGASATSVQASVAAAGLEAETPAVPPDVANLSNVRSLPLFLAAFLVVLAIGAVAHALLTGARSRSHDLAVLRALGLTPRQAGACVTWQAAVIGVIALAIGVPLGLVIGRQVWRVLADSLSFVYVGPLSGLVLVVVVPVALVTLALLALWPARVAARLRTAEVLRTE